MGGFLSGVIWGLIASAVVLVVVSLQLGDPPGAVVVEEAPEPEGVVLPPRAEPEPAEGEVVVTTDPPTAGTPDEARVGGEATATTEEPAPAGDPNAAGSDMDAPAFTEGEEPAVGEEATAPASGPVEVPGADPVADGAADDAGPEDEPVEGGEDGTVIEMTVPVEPVEDAGE